MCINVQLTFALLWNTGRLAGTAASECLTSTLDNTLGAHSVLHSETTSSVSSAAASFTICINLQWYELKGRQTCINLKCNRKGLKQTAVPVMSWMIMVNNVNQDKDAQTANGYWSEAAVQRQIFRLTGSECIHSSHLTRVKWPAGFLKCTLLFFLSTDVAKYQL